MPHSLFNLSLTDNEGVEALHQQLWNAEDRTCQCLKWELQKRRGRRSDARKGKGKVLVGLSKGKMKHKDDQDDVEEVGRSNRLVESVTDPKRVLLLQPHHWVSWNYGGCATALKGGTGSTVDGGARGKTVVQVYVWDCGLAYINWSFGAEMDWWGNLMHK
ncbi:hypothetical protein BU17DRAFT_68024 [Hysterangium stoloniferum]|nr:hypothetical protein BU17DRAFT_68024 [Hysterangium stoloniferum]